MGVSGDNGCCWLGAAGIAFACFVLYSVYRINKRLNYFKKRGFPALPFWKSVKLNAKLFTFRMNLIEFLDEIYKYFEGEKVGGYYQMTSNNLMVKDPDLINRILIKDFSYFHDHGFKVDTDVNPLDGHLLTMNGHKWRALRNKLTPTFTTGKLRGMLPQMAECSDNLVELMKQIKPGEDVHVHDVLSRFVIDVIGSCAFGIDAGAIKDPDCEFRRMAKKIFRPGMWMQWKNIFRIALPQLALKLKMKSMDDEVTNFFFGITRQAFEHRMKTGLKRNDFVDLLLQLKLKGSVDCDPKELAEENLNISPGDGSSNVEEESEQLVLTDGLLAAQAFIFLAAGWENTASVISFTLYFLAKHQDVQERARREVREAKEKHGGQTTYEAMKEMIYLEACISESLRLFTPAVALIHSCTKDYTLDDGRVIDKGTSIWMPIFSMQRDSTYFHDADEFRPERFMPDHEVPSNVFLPFGDGPRICIARRFVLLEVKHVVSKLLENFRLTVSPKTKEPIQISRKFFIVEAEGGLWLRLQPLEDQKQ